ncbi:phosphate/phosphite/phosphonate ABC transporter substrate-binding protein [Reichenbachiella agarivorans]|uniref:Phosphate/phosphite/phosphonate ABC transporter substrate-binding protein n=1 Tax=Reichenbachiella agarivorans TaxID=2979464 RepID=A0ABY6CSG4_9BACT|nr:phosphate/phosphite/phosphonate ABC transporter substrate-binding protein [Reichenbachiella agarivorans]UXP33455.1 phosphate/phosphite/phosphonate ABC transporter substrate-binding protein [Reichenbachiella agarivorans]
MNFRLNTVHTALLFVMMFLGCTSPQDTKTIAKTESTTPKEAPKSRLSADLGTPDNPINLYLTPSRSVELVEQTGKLLINYLHAETALNFELQVSDSYDDMIKAFASNDGDIALMNSASYIKARDAYGVNAKLKAIRYGKSNYYGQIIANTNSGIDKISDIQGKSVVYTDSLSTSGYLFPKKIFADYNIQPAKTAFAGTHDRVVKMVYMGIADAGATYYSEPSSDGEIRDARSRLLSEFPDVAEKVKILQVTEAIPNDPVVFGKHVNKDISFQVSLALIKYLETPEGKNAMSDLYSIEGYTRCTDADYDGLRRVLN